MWKIREAGQQDAETLGRLLADSVRAAGPEAYSVAQVAAWAAAAADPGTYGRRLLKTSVFVAEDSIGAVGFASIADDGHLSALYVRGDRQRMGIGRSLVAHTLEEAKGRGMTRVYAEASLFSLPLFKQMGFVEVGVETVTRGGAAFERYLVQRLLPDGADSMHP